MWDNPDLVLYHGTTSAAADAIQRNGIDVRVGRCTVDFGQGFYLTTNRRQAEAWADRQALWSSGVPEVLRYEVPRLHLAEATTLVFIRGSKQAYDYWSFVDHCRTGGNHARSVTNPWYDLVAGPVAIPRSHRVHPDFDQFSIHTDSMARMFDQCCIRFVISIGP